MSNKIFKNWWMLLIAGCLFAIVGVSYLVNPGAALLSAGIFLGILFLSSGISTIAFALPLSGSEGRAWGLATGIMDTLLGIMILWNPFASALFIPIAIGIWAIVRGVIIFVDSFSYKKIGINDWWGFLLLGIVNIIFGFLMLRYIGATAIVTGWMIGVVFLLIGTAGIYYSIKIRKL